MHWMFTSIPGSYILDAHSCPQPSAVTTKNICRHCQMSPGVGVGYKLSSAESHWWKLNEMYPRPWTGTWHKIRFSGASLTLSSHQSHAKQCLPPLNPGPLTLTLESTTIPLPQDLCTGCSHHLECPPDKLTSSFLSSVFRGLDTSLTTGASSAVPAQILQTSLLHPSVHVCK